MGIYLSRISQQCWGKGLKRKNSFIIDVIIMSVDIVENYGNFSFYLIGGKTKAVRKWC